LNFYLASRGFIL